MNQGNCCRQTVTPGHQEMPEKVVDQIDTLTSDLQLEDEMTDSSKTDTLNSSSSGTASSLEKIKAPAPARPRPAQPSAVLTVLRRPRPPPPPPRLTPVTGDDTQRVKTNGSLLRGARPPGTPGPVPNGDAWCAPRVHPDTAPELPLTPGPE
ncbi:PREDICTED: protein Largen, partial [Chinchilla lanigera]|uniref:protein Largen n=1 Tax=Chinchilla lanigera TaxID=34839 RepID=UPI000696AFF2